MKIALDATYSAGRNLTGLGVYSRAILEGLAAAHPESRFLWCYRPHRFLRSFLDAAPQNCRRRLLNSVHPPSANLFHSLNQRIDWKPRGPAVATFHDLFVMTGDYSTPEFRARFTSQAAAAAERSDLIIAVSAFTGLQVQQLLKVEPGRIRVIHHGCIGIDNARTASEREPMILFVGALQRRKNVARLVDAFERIAPGWKLVLAGSFGFGSDEILRRIQDSPCRDDIQTPGYVSSAQLDELYRRASIFAFPSLDEGFGMPVLDAMAHGIPTLVSNVSALPEVSGGAALLVDPTDTNSIAAGLAQLIGDPALRDTLIEKGFARALEFSWEKAVEKTWNVYKELLP
ncbi:MAG TPA: glycosyltransferase family 1 protein [Bryobacteraceae bacterium]|nr:glycosyltransferase family 1 protein [Bryobacteraceae bacterium]